MNTCLAVMAHMRAADTLRDFQPRWERLGLPIYGFVPEGETWPICGEVKVFAQGKSAHRGEEVYRRFIQTCEALLTETDHDAFVIMEYDTVNLSDRLPKWEPDRINSGILRTIHEYAPRELGLDGFYVAMSPWIARRDMLERWVETMKWHLGFSLCCEWIDGLLDRWLAVGLYLGQLPVACLLEVEPWPINRPNPHQNITARGFHWVHGWKSRKEFRELWPEVSNRCPGCFCTLPDFGICQGPPRCPNLGCVITDPVFLTAKEAIAKAKATNLTA